MRQELSDGYAEAGKWEKPSVKEYGSVDEILDEIVDFAVERRLFRNRMRGGIFLTHA